MIIKKKWIITIVLLFLVLLTVSAVSASSFRDAQTAIDNSTYGKVFLNNLTYTYENGESVISINTSNLVIYGGCEVGDGKTSTLNGNHSSQIMNVTGSNITFIGINFINGKAAYGGAILILSSNKCWVNCTFTGNSATYDGGAICFYSDTSIDNVSWTGCNFINNTAKTRNGGAIYFNTGRNISWTGCNFINNTAKTGNGGAINLKSGEDNKVNYCIFDGNSAYRGKIIHVGTSYVLNFENNFWGMNNTITPNDFYILELITDENSNKLYPYNFIVLNINATGNGYTLYFARNGTTEDVTGEMPDYISNVKFNDTINVNSSMGKNPYPDELEGPVDIDVCSLYSGDLLAKTSTIINSSNVTVKVSNITVGESAVINVTVDQIGATGNVTISVNGTNHTGELVNGYHVFTVEDLEAGDYVVGVTYTGDDTYNVYRNNESANFSVNKIESVVNGTFNNITVGENATVTVTVDPNNSTGTVTVHINDHEFPANLNSDGTATVTVDCDDWSSGEYTFNVTYSGDDTYSNATSIDYVLKIKDVVNVISSNVTVVYGETAVIEVSVDNTSATGNVTVHINDQEFNATLDSDGTATVTLTGSDTWSSDEYTFNVTYDGDDSFANATSIDYVLNITKADSTPVITPTSVTEGSKFTITVTFNDTACGNITVKINNQIVKANLTGGIALLNFTALSAGTYDVFVSYSGDGNYTGFTDVNVTTLTVTSKPAPVHDYKLTADNVTKFVNGTECYIVTLTDNGKPLKNEIIFIYLNGKTFNATTDKNGKATFKLDLPVGNYTVTAKWNILTVKNTIIVKELPHDYKLSADNITKFVNETITYTVTLTDNGQPVSNETIIISLNGETFNTTTDKNGKASFNLDLKVGNYTVTAKWNNLTVNNTITVKALPQEYQLTGEDITKYFKGSQRYTVTLTKADKPLSNETITITINGKSYTRVTNENGTASIAINLNPSTYTVTASWKNLTVKNTVTVKSTIHCDDFTKYYLNGTQYEAYVLDSEGNPLDNVNITFNIHGVFYTRTAHNGTVKMNINLIPGEYIITAYNDVTGEASSATVKVLHTLVGKNLTMNFQDGSAYECKLVDGHGYPVRGVEVTFNIHGVFYHKLTDDNGIVRLNINLLPGEYIITAIYGSAMTSNTITVRDL